MLAEKPPFKPTNPDVMRKNGPTLRRTDRSNPTAPAPFAARGEDGRTALLEYAAFLLDQEAKYCQQ